MEAIGLAMFLPSISGAEPWTLISQMVCVMYECMGA